MLTYITTVNEFRRWLKKQGCAFEKGRKHEVVRLGDKKSVISRHEREDIKTGTMNSILDDLGLKETWLKERR